MIINSQNTLQRDILSFVNMCAETDPGADEETSNKISMLLERLQEIRKTQLKAQDQWEHQVEKTKISLSKAFDPPLQRLEDRMEAHIQTAVKETSISLSAVQKSENRVREALQVLKRADVELVRVLKSGTTSAEYTSAVVNGEATLRYGKDILKGVILEHDGALTLSKTIDETSTLLDAIKHIDCEGLLSIGYPSNDLFQNAIQLITTGKHLEGLSQLERVARQGFYHAQVSLAQYYASGIGNIPASPEKSIEMAKIASKSDNASGDVFHLIAVQYLLALDNEQDALIWAKLGAARNDVDCLRLLACDLRLPESESYAYTRKAAELHDSQSALKVAEKLEKEADFLDAEHFYKIAVRSGDSEAQFKLGCFYSNALGDFPSAEIWFRKAAMQGHAYGQYRLAFLLDSGMIVDDNNDPDELLQWYTMAAEQGVVDSMFHVAQLMEDIDYETSTYWLNKAASFGCGDAEAARGGRLVQEGNIPEAMPWLEKAAEQGIAEAFHWLGKICLDKKDYTQAFSYLVDASENGYMNSCILLSDMYTRGLGILPDMDIAKGLLKKAALSGSNEAMEKLDELTQRPESELQSMRRFPDGGAIPMPEPVKFEFFFKSEGKNKYQRTLFVFTGPFLSYFKQEADSYPTELLPIRNLDVLVGETVGENRFFFTFVIEKIRTIDIYASHAHVRDE